MNLFRSEEHAKNWSRFEPESADGILPVAEWARLFSGPLFRDRLSEDYLSRIPEGRAAFVAAMSELAARSPFWRPA